MNHTTATSDCCHNMPGIRYFEDRDTFEEIEIIPGGTGSRWTTTIRIGPMPYCPECFERFDVELARAGARR